MSDLIQQMNDFQIIRENTASELAISQKKHRPFVERHNAVIDRINNVAYLMYTDFYDFVQNNRDLYDQWFMYNQHRAYRGVRSVTDRPLKKAYAVNVVESDNEGHETYPTYLVPYLLLEDPAAYREQRLADLEAIKINNERSKRANTIRKIKDLESTLEDMDHRANANG